jgi:hypothetical protein
MPWSTRSRGHVRSARSQQQVWPRLSAREGRSWGATADLRVLAAGGRDRSAAALAAHREFWRRAGGGGERALEQGGSSAAGRTETARAESSGGALGEEREQGGFAGGWEGWIAGGWEEVAAGGWEGGGRWRLWGEGRKETGSIPFWNNGNPNPSRSWEIYL